MIAPIIQSKITPLIQLLKDNHVIRAYLFGSVCTDTFNDKSDVDLLISFSEEISPEVYTDSYFALHEKIRKLLGREVDIITERCLSNPIFIQNVNNSKRLLYESEY